MRVNKRIGKLRQWTGEKLGGQAKTGLSEDFQALEQDVELRRLGQDKIYTVSKEFARHLGKKIDCEQGEASEKVLMVEAVGLVFAGHGDEFSGDSAFGQSLREFGKAHQMIGEAQTIWLDKYNDEWISSLEKGIAQIGEYVNQRKKLDSRRLTYDAMLGKVQKSKKEKVDLESDLRLAKNRYEETSVEVTERGEAIQENEPEQLAALSRLLEAESEYVNAYKEILDDLKSNWVDQYAVKNTTISRRKSLVSNAHTFGVDTTAPVPAKATIKTRNSTLSRPVNSRNATPEPEPDEVEPEEAEVVGGDGFHSKKASSLIGRSRSSTLTRKKSASTAAEDKHHSTGPRFSGIRIPGLPGGGGNSSKDYANMSDPSIETSDSSSVADHGSRDAKRDVAPRFRRSMTAPASPKAKRVVEAKWDYHTVEPDELAMRVGDRIAVSTEVNAEWYIGQCEQTGQSGMFPSAYVVPATPFRGGLATPPADDRRQGYLLPDQTGMSDVSDTFADTQYSDEEDEKASLRPIDTLTHVAPSGSIRHMPSMPKLSGGMGSTTGKRAPPPPPPARRATLVGEGSGRQRGASGGGKEEIEAFGSVSELKKKLGMFK